jgi:hypothetical protein
LPLQPCCQRVLVVQVIRCPVVIHE